MLLLIVCLYEETEENQTMWMLLGEKLVFAELPVLWYDGTEW